jgi:hypothetical protein
MRLRRSGIAIWGCALLGYLVFAAWYVGVRGPLSRDEIESYLTRLAAEPGRDPAQLAALKPFLEADDGGEFFMVNLIRMEPGEVTVPGTDRREPAANVVDRYTRPFLAALLRRAGHPAFAGPAAADYLEHWGVEPNPGWSFAGVIRYRSRRDMLELVVDPVFEPAHVNKRAAMANTLAFPVAPPRIWIGPRVWVGLAIGLLAALAHVALLSAGLRRAEREA